jgi:UDP-glucose 4-epimerase
MTASLRIALTGATGFIGRRLTRALLDRGHTVRAIVRDRARASAMAALDRCSFFELDLDGSELDVASLDAALDGIDVLCHSAALIPKDLRDARYASRCLRVNALATLSFVEACVARKTPRMLYVSSANVYTPSAGLVTEDAPTYPASRATYYLASKLCGELYVEHARRRGALSTTTLRVSSVYGPQMSGGVVALFADRLSRGERVRVSDGGRYQTDLVYVDDVVSAAVAAIERPSIDGVINVGSGRATTLLELARALAALMNRGEDAIEVEPASDAAVDLGFAAVDVSRARTLLDYAPRSLHEGLRAWLAER